MAVSVADIFGKEYIDALLSDPEVIAAKQKIDSTGEQSVHFTVGLDAEAKAVLRERLGLDLSMVDAIPMRWIKGDTHAHTDTGTHTFENTYLVYLTDSPGSLVVDGQAYPIRQGTAYVFSEGLHHETVETGVEPRLLLGPMSEAGTRVGYSGIAGPGGSTIYIRQVGSDYEWGADQTSWSTLFFPAPVYNTDTAAGVLTIEFLTDLSFSSVNNYFECNTDNIQIGSSSLKTDGSRPIITIDGVIDYEGLIQNGSEFNSGNSNIYVYNIVVNSNDSTMMGEAGWIGRAYFGKDATNNYFINCASNGTIAGGGGGVVGQAAGTGAAELTLIGCYSSGTIGGIGGGIVGQFAGLNGGRAICISCWSTGSILPGAGGIFGQDAGYNGYVKALNCYTIGAIGNQAGGIFGKFAGSNNGEAIAENCYSRGNAVANAGGIFGFGSVAAALNCYSAGTITTPGTGIYGPSGSGTQTNCYVANGSWSTADANVALTGVPTGSNVIGETWVSAGLNQPYELLNMGYTPYTVANITDTRELNRIFEVDINAGESIGPAIISDRSYTILQIISFGPSIPGLITIDSTTGIISTLEGKYAGRYIVYIRNTGSYNITTVDISFSGGEIIFGSSTTCCARRLDLRKLDYTTRAEVIGGNVAIGGIRGKQLTHGEYLRIKKAYAFKR